MSENEKEAIEGFLDSKEISEEQLRQGDPIENVGKLLDAERSLDDILRDMGVDPDAEKDDKEPEGIYFVRYADGPVQAKCGLHSWSTPAAREKVTLKRAFKHHTKYGCPVIQEGE